MTSNDPAAYSPSPTPEDDLDDLDLDGLDDTSTTPQVEPRQQITRTLVVVETAFLASTAALIWLINFYFPIGPLWRIFFPIPIALAFLRWNRRTALMTALVAALLLSVLMGPPRSLQFLMPHGFLGVVLGGLWKRRVSWWVSIAWGSLLSGCGLLFQVGLLSVLLGENLWLYVNQQVTNLIDWGFTTLGILAEANLFVVQLVALVMILVNGIIYNLIVHLAAWLLLERVGNPIPDPPTWLESLFDYRD